MLDKQPINRHSVAVDDQPVVARVLAPADAIAMVGAPQPEVVPHHIIGVNLQTTLGAAGGRPAHAHEDVVQAERIARMVQETLCRSHLQQRGGLHRARVE